MYRQKNLGSSTYQKLKHKCFKTLRKRMSLTRIRDEEKLKTDSEDEKSDLASLDQELEVRFASEFGRMNTSQPPSKPAKGEIVGFQDCLQTYMYCTQRLRTEDISVRTRGERV